MARDQRRLAAIVSADVVGYSLLMGRDDSATLAGLKGHRQELIDPKIAEYGGRIVKTTGDGLLLEFPSVVDAVRCAVDVQRGMAERNAGVPAEQRIEFRIGINVGDIIIDGDDIFGDGVNVAARLQTLAEAGGICVSRVVRDQVLDKLSFAFEDLGAQQVKNITRPVEAYRVDLGSAALQTLTPGRKRWQRMTRALRWRWLAAGAIAIAIVGIAFWTLPQFWRTAPTSTPPAFSVAILAFAAPGGAPADQQFAELLTQQITGALGRAMHYATIVSPYAATEAGKAIDTRAIGRERNVRYLLEGDVHIDGDRVSVTGKLVDAESGTQLWSDQFDAARSKWVADSGEASWPLISRLRGALWSAEEQRVAHGSGGSANAWDLVLRGEILQRNRSLEGMFEARKLYDEAVRLDPTFTTALVQRAFINYRIWEDDPSADRLQLAQETDEFARRALAIDKADPRAWSARAGALQMQWRWDAALEAEAQAMRLEPWSANVTGRSWILDLTGHADEALPLIDKAIALEPNAALIRFMLDNQCYAHLLLGQFDKAIASCEKSVAIGDDWWPYMFLAAAYAQTGDMAKASTSKAELLRRRPGFSIARFNALGLSDNPVFLQQIETNFIPGLRKAGIPEN